MCAGPAPHDEAPPADPERSRGDDVVRIVRELVVELHPGRRHRLRVSEASTLDRDLGLDSLTRAELLLRLERSFGVRLPAELLGEAETVGDLVTAVARAAGPGPPPSAGERRPALATVEATPEAARTLTEVLDWHARRHSQRPHAYLHDGPGAARTLAYGELAANARAVAHGLRRWGLEPGERAALMLPTGFEFFEAFFGVLYAGGVPVPIYPPARASQLEQHLRRQAGILANAGAAVLLAPEQDRRVAGLLAGLVDSLRGIEAVERLREAGPHTLPVVDAPGRTALLQYTSGSTGDPKGVVLSHANLLANIRAMGDAMEASSADVFASWLPLYHDMGLIGAWLGSLYYAAPFVVMSPVSFLAHPGEWLWAIHRYHATLSAAPNFGFELCLSKLDDEALRGLDLSSLRMVANGAEPVNARTVRRFIARFAPFGFRPEAMAPVYGLAENAVGLAFPPLGRPPVIDRVQRRPLARRGEARPAGADEPDVLEVVACGRPLAGHEIRIVDETGREAGERREGRLQFRGPSATSGYFRSPAKTRELFDGDWLESGDRAYLAGGDVCITGRVKDIIIRAGRNVYPQEVEAAVGEIPGIRKGCVAVFGSPDPATGTERIVVLAETRETEAEAKAALSRRVSDVAAELLEEPPDTVLLAPPRSVPKTSSGKIRRAAAREVFERGGVATRRALWWQVLRLGLAGLRPRLRRFARAGRALLYAGWWWSVVGVAAGALWPTVMLLPRRRLRWAAVRSAARTMLALTATPVRVEGLDHLPERGGILVANHSSYLDAAVLSAVLPGELAFVAKKELARQFFAGRFLRRLGTLFVERAEPEIGVADARWTAAAARAGERIVSFPEGTLLRMPGLLPFRLGAFVVAAQTDTAVLPVTLHGTRSVLRAGQWFPRRGGVRIAIASALRPEGGDFAAAVRLREAARARILDACGEPDMAA